MHKAMKPSRAIALLSWIAIAMTTPASGQGVGQSVGQQEVGALVPEEPAAIPASLQEIYTHLAESWESQDAHAIARLAREGRVFVVVQREGISERLAASQLQYLLEEMFDSCEEVDFRFPAYSAYDPAAGTGYAVGERVYRADPGLERSDRVFVGARNERGRWALTELRLTVD